MNVGDRVMLSEHARTTTGIGLDVGGKPLRKFVEGTIVGTHERPGIEGVIGPAMLMKITWDEGYDQNRTEYIHPSWLRVIRTGFVAALAEHGSL